MKLHLSLHIQCNKCKYQSNVVQGTYPPNLPVFAGFSLYCHSREIKLKALRVIILNRLAGARGAATEQNLGVITLLCAFVLFLRVHKNQLHMFSSHVGRCGTEVAVKLPEISFIAAVINSEVGACSTTSHKKDRALCSRVSTQRLTLRQLQQILKPQQYTYQKNAVCVLSWFSSTAYFTFTKMF